MNNIVIANYLLSLCDKSYIIKTLLTIKTLLKILCYLAPIIIIIISIIHIFKVVTNGKEDDLKDALKVTVKRITAGLLIAFIPGILSYTFSHLLNNKLDFLTCMEEATLEKYEKAKNQEEIEEEMIRKAQQIEDEELLKESYEKDQAEKEKQKKIFEEYKRTHSQGTISKLDYSNAIEIPDSVLKSAAPHSDLSVLVVDDTGKVIASRKPMALREGGSTTKIFTGYAAVSLLDPVNDVVINTAYAQKMPYVGSPDVRVGDKFSVPKAATKDFPGSSNITTGNIAIAIGKKLRNSKTDKQAFFDGMDEINKFLKDIGCSNTKLSSPSGVNYNYATNKFVGGKNGYSINEFGMSANDLGLVTVAAMKNEYFANGINYGRNGICSPPDKDSFFIKSGTQAYCHGVWGYNKNGKRYYVVILGVNCNKSSDNKCKVFNSVYKWAKTIN